MFNFYSNAQKVSDLTTQNTMLKSANETLKQQFESLKSKEDTTVQPMSIDFNKLDAFSIERNGDKHEPCTIIGHFMTNAEGVKTTAEWYLYCSPKIHNQLVSEFNEFKLKGSNGTK